MSFRESTIGQQRKTLFLGEFILSAFQNSLTQPPRSDGAGEVVEVGSQVTRFQVGQRVVAIPYQTFLAGSMSISHSTSGIGGAVDGVLCEYGTFNEQGLVLIPDSLSYREAATLPCAGLTAWNALYGAKALKPGDTVLVQGTGGVSIFALQFALAGGAQVIATTSDSRKEDFVRHLGAHHVINYKNNLEWGERAKELSLNGRGADYIIEIGGPTTMMQSFAASAIEGTIAVIGTRGGRNGNGGTSHTNLVTTRRIIVGNRLQMEEMVRAISANNIKPVIDPMAFEFADLKLACHYLEEQKHIGKIVVDVA